MRISDWSSDVCSSDLVVLKKTSISSGTSFFSKASSRNASATLYSSNVTSCLNRAARTPSTISLTTAFIRASSAICRSSQEIRFYSQERTCCNTFRRSDGSTSTSPAIIFGPTPMRSEEHTSELQSLMRISYAVFCLKQNNKLLLFFHQITFPYLHTPTYI